MVKINIILNNSIISTAKVWVCAKTLQVTWPHFVCSVSSRNQFPDRPKIGSPPYFNFPTLQTEWQASDLLSNKIWFNSLQAKKDLVSYARKNLSLSLSIYFTFALFLLCLSLLLCLSSLLNFSLSKILLYFFTKLTLRLFFFVNLLYLKQLFLHNILFPRL